MTAIAVLGAGPHGRTIAHDLASPGMTCRLYDDAIPTMQTVEQGVEFFAWVAGLAWPWERRQLVERIARIPRLFGAWNDGTVVLSGAEVSYESEIGRHVHVCQNAVVSHGCSLGDYSTVCPGAVLSGDVQIGQGVLIGAGVVVVHGGIMIGEDAVIGAGAVVLEDVPPRAVVAGNPARIIQVKGRT